MNFVHIVGNRPQFVKLALLYPELQRRSGGRSQIIHTGQHFDPDMSDIFFRQLGIPPPDHQLAIRNLSHNEMIGNMLIGIDPLLAMERPDVVVVYGDTNTTLAGALAAKKRDIPLVHVESGIRTGKEDMPEESNRYLTDRMASWNFACTYLGVENLAREGYGTGAAMGSLSAAGEGTPGMAGGMARGGVFNCGDLMLDAALLFKDQALKQSLALREWKMDDRPFILATIHRAENTDNEAALRSIVEALNILHRQTPVLFPMHPRTGQLIGSLGLKVDFNTTGPLGYLDMLALVQSCHSVVTDSGGLCREAYFFQKPALVIMQNPFWPELFIHGNCLRADPIAENITGMQQQLQPAGRPSENNIFGDGHAAVKISEVLTREVSGHG